MIQALPEGIFATAPHEIPRFNLSQKIVTCFIECENNILVLKRGEKEGHPHTWCIPGGKCEANESSDEAVIREIWEETQISLSKDSIQSLAEFYVRSARCGCDYLLVIYRRELEIRPPITLNIAEHQASQWIGKDDFCSLNLLPFQKQVFENVYQ